MEPEFSLKQFFSMEFEMFYNKPFSCPLNGKQEKDVIDYIKCVISTPLVDFLTYIKDNPKPLIEAGNITQASRVSLCHSEMCEALQRANDRGLTFSEIGWYLHNDNKERSKNTEAKFGENVKGAQQFGLTIIYKQKWYLTCLGKVFLKLNESERLALLARTLLRDPFYKHVLVALSNGDVNVVDYMIDISPSTIKRRTTSVKSFCAIVQKQAEIEGIKLFNVK